jgi:O-antigen ligase
MVATPAATLRNGRPLQQIAVLVHVADDDVRYIMKSTILWSLAVGALVALILVLVAVSISASGFRLDVELWVLVGAFLVVMAMAATAVVFALNSLKEAREQSTGDDAGNGTQSNSGDNKSGKSS